jgi:hypothetical protein
MYAKIKNYDGHLKDTNSGAILNNDRATADEYLAKKKMMMTSKNVQDEINDLKKDMAEIKELLKGLIK